VTKKYSIAKAGANLIAVVHEAEQGTRVELTRRGRPVAVLIGIDEFARLAEGRRDFWEAYQQFRREFDLASLVLDPDEIFAGGGETGALRVSPA
jgi:prevent-host-death family protein